MPNLVDLIARLQLIKQDLELTREEDAVKAANDLYALIRLRIQSERKDSTGADFGQYSTAVVPRWMGEQKALSGGARQRIRSGNWFQSYRDFREADGLQTQSIDFTRTGQMFQQSGVDEINSTSNVTTVLIGGQTSYAKQLLGYHGARFGNLFTPTEDEKQLVLDSVRERIERIFNTYL